MNHAEMKRLAGIWASYAAYYRTRLDDLVLGMYAEDLADLDFETVYRAMESYRKNPKNRIMPLPAQIRDVVSPGMDPESAAREIAARISAAVPKFGWPNGREARAFIGEVGWGIVERQGGWSYICEHLGLSIDPSTFQAQVREQAKADLKYSPDQIGDAIGLAPGARGGELQSAGAIIAGRGAR